MDRHSLTMSKSTDQNLLCSKVNKKRLVLLFNYMKNVLCVSGPHSFPNMGIDVFLIKEDKFLAVYCCFTELSAHRS